jgi:arsenic resistance protein ArsH
MKYLNDAKFDVAPTFDTASTSKPRVLILYGSLRETSFSRFASEEAARILEHLGAQVKIFNPDGLPLFDNGESVNNQKVQELRELVKWSEAQVWCSPEIHGNMSAVLKNQIDWIPLTDGAVRPTQGKTLAVMQVSGGSQSFNAVNNMRILGRWMRMLTIPNQSSVAKAWQEFDEAGNMKESSFRMRIVDVMEELIKFTLLTRDKLDWLVDRYSERQAAANLQTTKLVDDSKVLEPNS